MIFEDRKVIYGVYEVSSVEELSQLFLIVLDALVPLVGPFFIAT